MTLDRAYYRIDWKFDISELIGASKHHQLRLRNQVDTQQTTSFLCIFVTSFSLAICPSSRVGVGEFRKGTAVTDSSVITGD